MVLLVRAAGTAYERGTAMGEAFAEAVGRSVAFNRRYLAVHGVGANVLEHLLEPYLVASAAAVPRLVQQVQGMADGAGVPFVDVFLANAFEEVYGLMESPGEPVERCTCVSLTGGGRSILGHNEQWYAGDEGAVGLVLDVPDDGPALLAPVVAGTLPLVGVNELGGAFGTMSLPGRDDRAGVPRALVARGVLEAGSPAEALQRADAPDRAGGYSFLCAFPGGRTCVVESTATTASMDTAALGATSMATGSAGTAQVHTNHALAPVVAAAAREPSEASRSRLERATTLAASAGATVVEVGRILADHGAAGQDICVHPDPAEGDEGSTVLFAMIGEPDSRSLWLSAGHPCTVPFERFTHGAIS